MLFFLVVVLHGVDYLVDWVVDGGAIDEVVKTEILDIPEENYLKSGLVDF